MFLIFDTETTGLPTSWNAPLTNFNNWPRVVQIAWQLHDVSGRLLSAKSLIVKPEGYTIPFNAEKVHGISTERALREGSLLSEVIQEFMLDVSACTYIAGHNIEFDLNVMGCELLRSGQPNTLTEKKSLDTKDLSTNFCALPGGKNGKFKWPTLTELHHKLFNAPFAEAHDAAYDVDATAKCFFALLSTAVIRVKEITHTDTIHYEAPTLAASNFKAVANQQPTEIKQQQNGEVNPEIQSLADQFVHLHVHSQYSLGIMQSTSDVAGLVKKAKSWSNENSAAVLALTDHANMMAAFQFVSSCLKQEVKSIVGCEVNLCRDMHDKKNQDNGFQIVLLAKTKNGYHNLANLSSLAHTQGSYYVPRIDRTALLQFKEDLIVLSGGMHGEIAWKILNEGEEKAEEAFAWWKEHFGEDFYAEIMRHGIEEENHVNKVLIELCTKHQVNYVATNSSYYTEQKDSEAQDALVCVREGEFVSRPKKYIGKRGREFRLGLPNNQYYLKSPLEMAEIFADLPDAIIASREIADKCERYKLSREILLPKFDIPQEFQDAEDLEDSGKRGENNYLRHLTYVGAEKRYGEVSIEIRERLDFELATIANTGYPGYFLIVQDFCNKAREMGVSVGPGRGSAAGSAAAYCIGITNVDPIKYQLLFERFLNPERVSMPDIDIDFDDEGRDKVIDYVRNKYGANMVAQIITYGTMGGKSAIRDAGRVIELPLPDTDRIAKCMPDNQDLRNILHWDDKKLSDSLSGDDLKNAKLLRALAMEDSHEGQVVRLAGKLEGSVRNTGIHACGVIITPDIITKYVPVSTAKESDMWCTQFDNSVVESAGLLKMDFLGLKTLTLIKDALRIIKQRHAIDIDIEAIPIDDSLTFQLFQKGHTVGIFQYESDGMQKYMKDLKPTVFDDLIAMNALYRPGPLEYIPSFVRRKNGQEAISYDLPEMEEYLKETYGITVYQEQVMLLSQKLAGFSKGEADVLRKAMGKKQKDVLDKMKGKFIEGASGKGHSTEKLEKIWTDWEAFASYAFNKSHSTCYAWIAYQTAYLKANYPAEYMAAVLSNNMSDIKQVSFFMQECKKQSIPVLGPDVNESKSLFSVNHKGEIRFGLAAVKGVGESAVESIIAEQKDGRYHSIFDFLGRIDSRASSKKTIENLSLSGALDAFGYSRSSYFAPDGKNETYSETLTRFATAVRDNKNTSQISLFGDSIETSITEPQPARVEPWDTMTQLTKEKDVIGMFISGHPLDDFNLEVNTFCSKGGLSLLQNLESVNGRELKMAGTVVDVLEKITKTGKPYGSFKLEDYETSHDFMMFGEEWLKFKHLVARGEKLFVVGRAQSRRFNQEVNSMEFKITRIELLCDIRKKMGRFLDISVPMAKLNDELVERIALALANGEGRTQVRIKILSKDGELRLPSNVFNKVNIESNALSNLETINEIEFAVSET